MKKRKPWRLVLLCLLLCLSFQKSEASASALKEAWDLASAPKGAGDWASFRNGAENLASVRKEPENSTSVQKASELEELLAQYELYETCFADIQTRDQIEESGYSIIEEQVFPMLAESFGEEELTLIPAFDGEYQRLALFLTEGSGKILWKTNRLETNYCIRGQLRQPTQGIAAISFQDANGDGRTDIILITNCANDTGEYAGRSYKMGDVLYQEDGTFYRDWRVSEELNRFGMNRSVDMILAHTRDGYSTEFLYTATTLQELLNNGFSIIKEHNYTKNFEKMGRLQIVPGVYSMASFDFFMIYLVNNQGDIVWSFQPMEDYENLYALKGMICQDLDGDGMKDLAVLASLSYTNEENERVVDVKCRIYYQRTDGFDKDTEFQDYYQCTKDDALMDVAVKIRKFWGWELEQNDKDTDRR